MEGFDAQILKKLYIPASDSHKGQNGKVLVIGGSRLFHAASLWALSIASKIVDMVFYASVPENNEIVLRAKEEFRNGIVIPRSKIEDYVEEAECILIGPGLVRNYNSKFKIQNSKVRNLEEINSLQDEGEQTYFLTKLLLEKYPEKKFVIDAGSLQMMDPKWLFDLKAKPILTPHNEEFERILENGGLKSLQSWMDNPKNKKDVLEIFVDNYRCVVLLKGKDDIVAGAKKNVVISGGNAGMTKGGTGDVLAGLTAALYAKNDAFTAAAAASFLNKKAGESLFEKVGIYFNASDLVGEVPVVMKKYLGLFH